MKTLTPMKKALSALATLSLSLGMAFAATLPANATGSTDGSTDTEPKKVYVCKYVGTPGVNETLQTGNNPIEVSDRTLKDFDGTFPYPFPDAQGRSVAIGYVGGPVLTAGDCPAPQTPPTTPDSVVVSDGWSDYVADCVTRIATSTRSITTYDWTLVNNQWVQNSSGVTTTETQTRAVTAEECPPTVDLDYVTVAWWAPGGASSLFEPDQQYLFHIDTEDPNLDALDTRIAALDYPKCYIQVDVYYDSTTTDALIAGGVLRNWNDPQEDLIPGGQGTAWKFVTLPDCAPPQVKAAIPVAPTGTAGIEQCVDGNSVDANGTITINEFEGGYLTDGEGNKVTGTLRNVAPGEYGFNVVIKDGYTNSGDDMVTVTVPESVDVDCDFVFEPPTLGPVNPAVTFTQMTCDEDGTITLSNDQAAGAVIWTIDGREVSDGTYNVSTAGTVTVTASANGPEYRFENEQQTTWQFTFVEPAACDDLPTLALTGSDPTLALTGSDPAPVWLASALLLLLGGTGLAFARTRRQTVG